jgi:glycopeptide antibiotics resistance protein
MNYVLVKEKYVYFRSAVIVDLLGFIDELYQGILPLRYFTWYDIFLNGLGGVLGLTIF